MPDNKIISVRKVVHDWLVHFIETEANADKQALKTILKDRARTMAPAYGEVKSQDFGELAEFVQKALAYNNKQFYVYKAVSNPNKIGFLSRKQFYKMINKTVLATNAGENTLRTIRDYLGATGKMSSPYKLLKKALKENPRVRFLAPFFKLNDDGTTENEDKLIELCDVFMSKAVGLELVETSVQECYNLSLPDGYAGSGRRYATHSCMYRKPVGKFYESLPCHGMMIMRNGEGVGRFLLWDLADGRQYVDRLYCRGREANACLDLIDRTYPNALKYPLDTNETLDIKFKTLGEFEKNVMLPYVDTFYNLHSNGSELCVSNRQNDHNGYKFQVTVRRASNYKIKRCPHCNHLWLGYGSRMSDEERYHKYICKAYKPRGKELQAYLEVFRKMDEELGGINDVQGFIYEV